MFHSGKRPCGGSQLQGRGCAKLLLVLCVALGFELLSSVRGAGGESTATWLPWLVFKLSFSGKLCVGWLQSCAGG